MILLWFGDNFILFYIFSNHEYLKRKLVELYYYIINENNLDINISIFVEHFSRSWDIF